MSEINKWSQDKNKMQSNMRAPGEGQSSDSEMDRYLTNKASALRYPPTPDIASAVGSRLAAEKVYTGKNRSPVLRAPIRRPGVAVVLAAALAVLVLVAVPQVRAFVGNLSVGVWKIIQNGPQPPNVPGVPTVTPISPWDPRLVGETDLGNAIVTMGGTTLLPTYPADLGLPDHVYYQRDLNNMIIYVWMEPGQPDTPRLALYRFPDTISGSKILAPDSQIITQTQKVVNNQIVTDTLMVGDDKAEWIEGQYLFQLNYLDDNGNKTMHMGELIDGNTLLWGAMDASYSYKLVTSAHTSLDEALRIAESMKPMSPPPTPYPTTTPTSRSSRLDLAGELSFYQVDDLVGFKVKVPVLSTMPELVAPDKIYLQPGTGNGNMVVMAWFTPGRTDELRMVMTQGKWDDFLDNMNTNVDTVVGTTTVHGITAQWVEGPQYLYANMGQGDTGLSQRSLITNSHTLVWVEDGRKYRLESALSMEDAVAVAESLK